MKIKMLFFMVELYVIFVLSRADVWRNESEMSMYNVIRMPTGVDIDITEGIKQEVSQVSCSIQCSGSASFYYIENKATCICNSDKRADEKENEEANGDNVNAELIYGIRTATITTSSLQASGKVFKRIHKQPEPRDCLALFQQGYFEDGVYVINPAFGTNAELLYTVDGHDLVGTTVEAWCDMTNGGWTVIQRRQDGSEEFYRDWNDYKNGFGNIIGEYWLGLDNIHLLTFHSSSLYIEMETFGDVSPESSNVEYSTFSVNDESDMYRLVIGGYSGICKDSMSHHNNTPFSTHDSDNDNNNDASCAVKYTGAWWYNLCLASNLNGRYLGGADSEYGQGVVWTGCWVHTYSLKRTVMKIKRNV